MKSLVVSTTLLSLVGMVAACAPNHDAKIGDSPQRLGMANPASEYCVKKGGKLEIRKNSDGGEYGVCHLADGAQIEEWELFRRDNAATIDQRQD